VGSPRTGQDLNLDLQEGLGSMRAPRPRLAL